MSERIGVLCPGRGSYTSAQLGSLAGLGEHEHLSHLREELLRVDTLRAEAGDAGVLEIDGAAKFSSRFLHGENAAPLTFAVTARDYLSLDAARARVVAVAGNSMGWYSALFCAGALSLRDSFALVSAMGSMTRGRDAGGQIIYPMVDADWRPSPELAARVEVALAAARRAGSLAGHSIRFGGFAVLWCDGPGVKLLLEALPPQALGQQTYPMQLFGNAAFHSELMGFASERGGELLSGLTWSAPRVPMIDGRGVQWRPASADPGGLLEYTLGHQVCETFDFRATVRVMLREYAPDRIVLLGPGDSLGAAVAQVMITEGWRGVRSRQEFLTLQARDPFLVSMARPEQAALVT